jgi:ubiquinone/menaquinone biosynthesis C-methylase UbiE
MFKVGTHNEPTRLRWTKETLQKIPAGLKILDAGAGECQFKPWCAHLTYVSQDFNQYDGSGNNGLQTGQWDTTQIDIVSDITAIPVKDASFDAVMCTEVLEHVPDPVAALKEMNRVLKPGGYLLITSPFLSLTHFAPYHFASGLNTYFYQHHLNQMGYNILEIAPNGNYFELVAQELHRVKSVARKYSKGYNWLDRFFIHLPLLTLQKLSKKDRGSQELGCFDIGVFARKK